MVLPLIQAEREVVVDHGGWSYTTVIGSCAEAFELPTVYGWETGVEGFAWVSLTDLPHLNLHSGMRVVLDELLT